MSFSLVSLDAASIERRERENVLELMDQEEFRAFYERTARPLWSYLSRITGDSHQADDLLQETFYRFYRAGARHDSESHRRNSLFQIGTNLVRDTARRGKRYQDVPLENDESLTGMVLASDDPTPERQATTRTDLGRAMKQLEPAQRELLWLAYAQGASHEEIAGILGLRVASVRTTLLRARQKLAEVLAGRSRAKAEAKR